MPVARLDTSQADHEPDTVARRQPLAVGLAVVVAVLDFGGYSYSVALQVREK